MKEKKMMLRKYFTIGLVLILFFGIIPFQAQAQIQAQKTIRIFMDGKEVLPQDQAPIILNNRTMVPVRVINEELGKEVKWDELNRRVIITSPGWQSSIDLPNSSTDAKQLIGIFIDGREIKSEDAPPLIINNRVMVPLRAISLALGREVKWDADNYMVLVMSPATISVSTGIQPQTTEPPATQAPVAQQPATHTTSVESETTILGDSTASSEQLRALLKQNNPQAPDLVDLYLEIGRIYGVRGDIAFCQAAKETGWWKFGGLALPEQNNYCGLSVTGRAATASEDLKGANPAKVRFVEGKHGAFFDCPASGVEAHIQHLYAYACSNPLPAGRDLLDPRFVLIKRGLALRWIDLSGKWAVPGYDKNKFAGIEEAIAAGESYGHSILKDYYNKALQATSL